jgi:hypothetical protein
MGFRFRRSIKIIPGLKINFGKTGFSSVSVGGQGLTKNFSKKGTRTTVGLPGTGLSYSSYLPKTKVTTTKTPTVTPGPTSSPNPMWKRVVIVFLITLGIVGYLLRL